MTRSNQSTYSPKLAKKAFKTELKAHGISYQKVVQDRISSLKENNKPIPGQDTSKRRNMGRQDGVQYSGDSFICSEQIDGTPLDDRLTSDDVRREFDRVWETFYYGDDDILPPTRTLSIMDLAKPAKKKGVHRQFEVIEPVERVIALEDFTFEDEDGSDIWSIVDTATSSLTSESDSEDSAVDIARRPAFSYASVVKGSV